MKWVVVILVMCGIFYAARRLMPSSSTIDTVWMAPQIRIGMSQDQVRSTVGGDPTNIVKSGIGKDETWYYDDRYDANKHLAIQFVDGQVYASAIQQ